MYDDHHIIEWEQEHDIRQWHTRYYQKFDDDFYNEILNYDRCYDD